MSGLPSLDPRRLPCTYDEPARYRSYVFELFACFLGLVHVVEIFFFEGVAWGVGFRSWNSWWRGVS